MSGDRHTGDFGRMLREARERKGVSLRQIANATKISVAVLEGLERNDISRLPGGIFGRAFVRSFASEVGLDPEATIQEFIAQFRSDTVTAGHPSSSERFEDGEALESRRRTALTFLALIVLGLPIAAATVYFTLAGRRDAPTPAPTAVVAPQLPPAVDPPAPDTDAPASPTAAQAPTSVESRPASAENAAA